MERLSGLGYPLVVGGHEPPNRGELLDGIAGAAAAVLTLTERIDRQVLDTAGPQLQILANVAVGYDNIDIPACSERNIGVSSTPLAVNDSTADSTSRTQSVVKVTY